MPWTVNGRKVGGVPDNVRWETLQLASTLLKDSSLDRILCLGLAFFPKALNQVKGNRDGQVFFLKPHRDRCFPSVLYAPSPPGPIKSGLSNPTEASLAGPETLVSPPSPTYFGHLKNHRAG